MDNNLKNKIQVLINKYKVGDFKSVLDSCSVLIKKYPKNDFLWNLTGLSFQNIGNQMKAITSFQNAIENNSKNISAINNLGISYKISRQYSKAEEIFTKLLLENPNYINAIINLANLKKDTYFLDEALSLYEKALNIDEKLPELHLNISSILQVKNKMNEAIDHLYNALDLKKNFSRADQSLSMLLSYKNGENEKHIKSMLDKLQNNEINDNDKILLNFGLGKAFEDKKDYEKSFEHYEKGNILKIKKTRSKIDYYKQKAKDIKEYFLNLDINKINKHSDNKKRIFILGLPRSGTTLLEKIISSHSKVSSVSEIGYFFEIVNKNIIIENKINQSQIDLFLNQNVAVDYENFLKSFNIKNEFVLDKTLTNFWFIGFIVLFFPNSKIIHSYRNPKDNCLSIFKNLFPLTIDEKWLYDQEEMGEYYLIYNDLMKFWNELFNNKIYNSKYEDLINDKEKKIKELINFCELEWDEKCLNHHKNANPIKTLSINQANKPIYKTSINSSKMYENKLSKLFSKLDKLN
tara:strand:- start:146 stop:1705 length:1560 start_codon:yes stop_codon:yes gene_type:complete